MWFVFALLSAIFISVRKVGEKRLAYKLHYFTFGWALLLFSLPILFVFLLLAGKLLNPFALGPEFWIPLIVLWLTFYPLSTFLFISALKHGELTKIMPLQSFGPIFALLLGWVLLGQTPSLMTALGIGIVVLGVYVLNLKGRYLHNPLNTFKKDKASLYMLVNLMLIAFAGVLNSISIRASEPIYYSFVSAVGAVPILYACARMSKVTDTAEIKQNIVPLSVAGSMFGASFVTHMLAISLGPLAYVSTIRSCSVLISVVLAVIYLKESLTKPKLVALILVTIGSVIVGFY